MFPRPASPGEEGWLDLLLPSDRPGYRPLREYLRGLVVIGEGRWGRGDLVFGHEGQEIDHTEGMQPVVSYGEIDAVNDGAGFVITLSVHQPNDDGEVEFQIGTRGAPELPDGFTERSRWSYACWSPGEPCPATRGPVREIPLNPGADLLLVISPAKHVLWLHDVREGTSTLIPVTNFHNELMLLKGVRDPAVAFDHGRLFTATEEFSAGELGQAFVRYNLSFRKIDPARLPGAGDIPREHPSLGERIIKLFRRGARN